MEMLEMLEKNMCRSGARENIDTSTRERMLFDHQRKTNCVGCCYGGPREPD